MESTREVHAREDHAREDHARVKSVETSREDLATSSSSSESPRIICNPRQNDRSYPEVFDWDSALRVI